MDDDGPVDGDDREDGGKKDRKPALGKLIVLPGGKPVDPSSDLGADYVVGPATTGVSVVNPEVIDPVAVDAELKVREAFVASEKMVDVIRRKVSTAEVIETTLLEMAEELSYIKYDRRNAAKAGKNTTGYSMSRIAGLRNIADLLLKKLEASRAERLDLQSPRFQAVFKVWMEFFYESMEKAGVDPQVIDLVFQQMKADMVGWEKRMDGIGD